MDFTFVNALGGSYLLLSGAVLWPLRLQGQLDWFALVPSFAEDIARRDHGVAESHLA